MMAQIAKVKVKDGLVEIHATEIRGKTEKEFILKSTEAPRSELKAAMKACEGVVRRILQFPHGWMADRLTVTGVSFSLSGEVKGAVVTGLMALDTADAPLCINTPHLPFDQYSPSGNSPTMHPDDIEVLETLEREAQSFLNGTRAQLELGVGA